MRNVFSQFVLIAMFALTLATPTLAVQPDEILSDAALEARARHLSLGLRCLVCQNQSIDDSDAPLAKDLRLLVRERLTAGDTDAAVIDYIVARYGDFVLLKPPLKSSTIVLWLSPILILLAGGWLAVRIFGKARLADGDSDASADDIGTPLTDDEQRALDKLLKS